jgi:exopolysaccharide/PEP-CTERM locus tyrosine autokinase
VSFIEKAIDKAKLSRRQEGGTQPSELELLLETQQLVEPGEASQPREIKDIAYTLTRTVPIEMETMVRNRLITGGDNPEVGQSYKVLRTHILQKTQAEHHNALMITSPMPEEGKTLTAINLAISLAQELTQTVLLVDVDLRYPSISRYFGFEAERGLVDYLEGKAEIPELLVHPQGIDGLVILPAGRQTDWAAELIRSPRMLELVPELKNFYPDRYVLFDLPPMLSFADALSFAPLADGIIMVVAARQTSREDLKRCQEMLKGRPIVGYVFNKAEDLQQSRYYRDYHYNGRPKRSWFFWMGNGKKK